MRPALIALAMALALAPPALAQEAAEGVITCGPDQCLVPRDRLARLEDRPFLFRGRRLTEDHPRLGDYRAPFARFPDAGACLTGQDPAAEQVDLLAMDWERLRDRQAREVCFFLVSASLDDTGLIGDWMTAMEMSLSGPSPYSMYDVADDLPQPALTMFGYWTSAEYYDRFPRFLNSVFGLETTTRSGININLTENGSVVWVAVVGSGWLN